jgi:hypothetical protein
MVAFKTGSGPTTTDHSGNSDEVEFLRSAYVDEEFVVDDASGSGHDGAQASPIQTLPPMTDFRLLDLPVELRYHVYSFLIPRNMSITFERCGWLESGEPDWTTNGFRKGEDVPSKIGGNPFYRNTTVRRYNHVTVETQLFRVSKFVSNEALCKSSL